MPRLRTVQWFILIAVVGYLALGVFFVGRSYGLGTYERIGPTYSTHTIINVPTGSDDATVLDYYDYLQLRHLQQQTETYFVNTVDLTITYGILGGVLAIFTTLTFMWYSRDRKAGLYPVEVYNGYIAEGAGHVDLFVWANYAAMVAFMGWYIWWNLTFGQWY